MMKSLACLLWLLAGLASGFAPVTAPVRRAAAARPLFMSSEEAEPADVDPFEAYEQTSSQRTVAVKDTQEGQGDALTAGQVISVAYKARLLGSGKQFDFSPENGYVFKTGAQKVIPGWEQGLLGMKVGGKRTIRIPPNLAYGEDWFKGTIPPSSHLEFDVELLKIAQSAQEETMMQLEDFGIGRAAGMAFFLGVLALSPLLPK